MSYLAQTSKLAHKTPSMAAMVSTNTIELPKGIKNLRTWMPESKEYTDFKDFNIVGGIFYKYVGLHFWWSDDTGFGQNGNAKVYGFKSASARA